MQELKKLGAFEGDEEPEPEATPNDDDFLGDSLFDEEDSLFNEEDDEPRDPLEVAKEKVDVGKQMEWEGGLQAALCMYRSALADFGGVRPKLEQRITA
eukprot:SAG11_NODE_8952_length_959_cov_1.365116_1_plen_97_part_10